MTQGDVESLVSDLFDRGMFDGFELSSTVFNFMLPRGTILNDNPLPGTTQGIADTDVRRPGVPEAEEADSLNGLGGYHGSVQIAGSTIYYAVGVFSETANGRTNGIPVFDAPWKNVVATFYHELNEARTDPDVEQVINGGSSSLLGWTSREGEECGDGLADAANTAGVELRDLRDFALRIATPRSACAITNCNYYEICLLVMASELGPSIAKDPGEPRRFKLEPAEASNQRRKIQAMTTKTIRIITAAAIGFALAIPATAFACGGKDGKDGKTSHFENADKNHDGFLTQAEVGAQRWDHMKVADVNNDNKVSKE